MNLKELYIALYEKAGVPRGTSPGWRTAGYIPEKEEYTQQDLEEILAKIPYCKECGKRLAMETTLCVCSKCNEEAKTVCRKCGAAVHKYFNRRLVVNPICRKCSLNEPAVINAVREGCNRSWALHGKERAAAVAAAVQMPAHREKMRAFTTNLWKSEEYKERVSIKLRKFQAEKWEASGKRDYPHATRLSLHVFRCKHCNSVYADVNLNNERQPFANYCPDCCDRYTGPEKIIEQYLKSREVEFKSHWRPKWLFGKELDFYIPQYNLAIEVDGVFYHSEGGGKDRLYHVKKTDACEENGIHLVHIWDLEIRYKWEVVKDRLNALLLKNTRKIGGRSCEISEIKTNAAREFLEKNHIQGFTPCSTYCGILHKGILIGVAAFHKGRTSNPGEWELARYASTIGMHISGGMSKAIAWFQKNHPNVPLISYADRRWTSSTQNAYSRFKCIRKTPPSYYYVYHAQIYRREKFMLKHLAKNPITASTYRPGMTERECCSKIQGLFKIWDCGQLLYRLI